ncbi:MAG: 3-phosphoshikimate 1-carboxyvinyltransferase [Candidatus Eremiobacteraeota bacterium]|nr:3-phosphoshikimate 1-carboxyvinyltransferase [Candidatus Eremiobacteraeota bacterium]
MEVRVLPRKRWDATLGVPGDKSISHRALIFSALGTGLSEVKNLLLGDDCLSTKRCLEAMGIVFDERGPGHMLIRGKGLEGFSEPSVVLDAGNSGTTMRLLSGLLAGLPFFSCISGDSSLNRRPMKRVIAPLELMGAKIWARGNNEYAPMAFLGSSLRGIEYRLPVASAQVKTALLLAGLTAGGTMSIIEPMKTRDHSEHMLQAMGVKLCIEGTSLSMDGRQALCPLAITVPGDFSSAAFFLAACAPLEEARLSLTRVGINETRTGFLDILREMGAAITLEEISEAVAGEPCATITIRSGRLRGVTVGGPLIPRSIDELPLLAALATQADGVTVVKDAHELRVKESDRIKAIVMELRKMGAAIEEREDGFEVKGTRALRGARVISHGDHRIAMSLAVAALFASSETVIEDAGSVSISFPQFFDLFHTGHIEEGVPHGSH